ncbi:hypothetical protein BGZ93_007766 [Podila epicladia]|nr:hypothetical protein BGZ92_001540 [Podila epicladia]KAG0093686.1 hypothetical protein BGZ93_007766 [Podila epicladia]
MKVPYTLLLLTLNILLALRAAEAVPTPRSLHRQLQHKRATSPPLSSSSSSSSLPSPKTKRKPASSKKPKKLSRPTSSHADLLAKPRQPSPASLSKRAPRPSSSPSPLLLLPDAQSIWQAGSFQLVKWSRKYAKRLPSDTTVDIVLNDSRTNLKVHSLKRFVPYAKGSALVYVPDKIQQDVTLGLTLELYHGKSQQPVASNVIATATGTPHQEEDGARSSALTSLMRRSEIHIAQDAKRPFSETTIQHDRRSDDENDEPGNNKLRGRDSLVVLPRDMREEYPNTLPPLELDHSFGVHQKVYTMAPYTLAWKVPARVQELLEYTENQHLLNSFNRLNSQNPVPTTFLARLKVELVKDQTLEPISTLARNVPAETKFQYLQIHDRVLQDFYRLRVQMVVVQVKGLYDVNQEPSPSYSRGGSSDGWDLPADAQVIDRYESITRRFWVTVGAL